MRSERDLRDRHEMKVGFPAENRTIEVDVAAGDIAPWDLDTKYRVVGTAESRIDAVAKVTGKAKYAYDMNLPGMLHAAILRSPHAAGKLQSVDLSAAEKAPGVRAVIAMKEPGARLRYVGDAIAAVAAERLDQALDALSKIAAQYEVADPVVSPLDADGAPPIDERGRVAERWPARDAEKIETALGGCEEIRDATFTVEVQTHTSLETHGMVVWCKDDGSVEVWASTQATFGVRQGLSRVLEVPEDRVRVHAEFVGGGFGSKFPIGDEGVAAAKLSQQVKAPVKLMLSRFEEHTCAGNRPSAIVQIRAGVDEKGTIKAWDLRNWGGPGFTGRGGSVRFLGSYLENAVTRNTQRDLRTDTDAARAMRAPGSPQGYFAAEGMIDLLAEAAGMDPLAFRLHNDADTLRQAEWKLGAERFGWQARKNPKPGAPKPGLDPRYRRGAGMAAAFWGQMGGTGSRVTCRIHADGTVEARNGAQDIGTGMKTVMAMLTAEELSLPTSAIRVTMGDTNDPPGPASGGSTTTPSLAPTVRLAAARAKDALCARVAESLRVDKAAVRLEGGQVVVEGGKTLAFKDACKLIGPNPVEATGERFDNYDGFKNNVCGCQFAEVLVDTVTGLVRVVKMLAVQDCGLVIAQKLAESQVLGAMIQGISYALQEQRIMDRSSGRMVNGDMLFYKIAVADDVPDLEAIMFPVANGKNNVGAAGLGEPPVTATAGAVANAVANAIGKRVFSLPITPDKVLKALAAK